MTIRQEICDLIHKKFGCKCGRLGVPIKDLYTVSYCELVEGLYRIACRLGNEDVVC